MSETASADMKDGKGNPIIATDLTKKKNLSKEEIEKLVKKISSTQVKTIVKEVEKIEKRDIEPIQFNIFDFQGFDPFVIISVFLVINEHFGEVNKVMIEDIKFCIAACLYMGNLQPKALTKRKAEGRGKIDYLSSKYNILMGSTGSGVPAEAVTFPRVVASFPVLSIKMASAVPPKAVNRDFMSTSIPSYMRLSPFASLCSPNMAKELRLFLMECCNAHGSDMSIAYEVGRLKKQKKEIKYDPISLANDQWGFVEVASDSPVPEEDSKKTLLASLDLPKDFALMEKVVKNYRAIMQKKKVEDVVCMDKKEFEGFLSDFISS
nr:MAG: coat protein [Sichuan phenui-like virus 3]